MPSRWILALPVVVFTACSSGSSTPDAGPDSGTGPSNGLDATSGSDSGGSPSPDAGMATDAGTKGDSGGPADAATHLDSASNIDSGTGQCEGPTNCPPSDVCCGTIPITGGTAPNCTTGTIDVVCSAASSCATSLGTTCTGTQIVRLCTENSDCTELGHTQCCTFGGDGGTLTFCASGLVATFGGGKCMP